MKKVLVTGCSGFIGQHCTRALLSRGYAVRGCDVRPYPAPPPEYFEFIQGDLTDPATSSAISDGIDIVIHLAAIPREDRSKSWNDYERSNVAATEALLNAADTAGVTRFVFISTVEAAGFGDGSTPRREDDDPNPVNFYGKSKLKAEQLVMHSTHNVERVVVRLPMIYGPGTDLIDAKLFGMVKKRFYPLIGNGSTLMEFCYVENAVHGILCAATHTAAPGELFYLSDERSYSIREVIEAIAAGVGVHVTFLPLPVPLAYTIGTIWEAAAKLIPMRPFIMPASGKPFFSRETVWWTTHNVNIVSTEKIRRMLGYHAGIPIDEGCRRTAQWFAERSSARQRS